MKNTRLLTGLATVLTSLALEGNGISSDNIAEAQEGVRTEEVITIPGASEYDLYKQVEKGGKKVDKYLGRIKVNKNLLFSRVGNTGLESRAQTRDTPQGAKDKNHDENDCLEKLGLQPGRYIVKPHPYKVGSLLIVRDIESEDKGKKPIVQTPVYHSTVPILSYPDGSREAYRTPKEGESLDDVLKEGPVDRFLPIPGDYAPKEGNKAIPIESLPEPSEPKPTYGNPTSIKPRARNSTPANHQKIMIHDPIIPWNQVPRGIIRKNPDRTYGLY